MSAILAISNQSGKYLIDSETMISFIGKIFPDKNTLRKLKYIWHETSIQKKYTVIPDFNINCKAPILFKNESFPSTSDRLKVYDKESVSLGKKAALDVISKSRIKHTDITHIITVSCTGMSAPGLESKLVEELKLKSSVKRFTVNFMGCYAAFHAFRLADLICKDEADSKILIVCVELCTLHLRNDTSDDNLLSTALFSDGASACIIGHPINNQQPYLECLNFDSTFLPEGKKDMAWKIGDQGFEMVLNRNISSHIENNMASTFELFLKKNKLIQEDIVHYAIHPGGKNILRSFEKSLKIKTNDLKYSYDILRDFGNMSSATVLFVLNLLLENFQPSDKEQLVFSAAFGPGLTIESGLFALKSPIA